MQQHAGEKNWKCLARLRHAFLESNRQMVSDAALTLSRLNKQWATYSAVLHYFALKKEDGRLCLSLYYSCCWVWEHVCMQSACVVLPQPSVLGCSSSRYDFGDEDAGVVAHMGVVRSPCYAKAQA